MIEIISALKSSPTPPRIEIIKYLESFNLKITHGIIEPNHVVQESLEEKLGFLKTTSMLPDARRLIAYNKWLNNPLQCTPSEIQDANEYRYTNNLFSPEEQMAFEKSLDLSMD